MLPISVSKYNKEKAVILCMLITTLDREAKLDGPGTNKLIPTIKMAVVTATIIFLRKAGVLVTTTNRKTTKEAAFDMSSDTNISKPAWKKRP